MPHYDSPCKELKSTLYLLSTFLFEISQSLVFISCLPLLTVLIIYMSFRRTVTARFPPFVDVAKEDDFWQWYQQTLEKGRLTDVDTSIQGLFILKVRLGIGRPNRSPDHLPFLFVLASSVCHLGEDPCISERSA